MKPIGPTPTVEELITELENAIIKRGGLLGNMEDV